MCRGIVESAASGIYIAQGGTFQYVSPMLEEISGYTADELIGTDTLNYIHPDDREAAIKGARGNLKGWSGSPHEFRLIRKDGDIAWVLERVASIQYRGERAVAGSLMDITEHKELGDLLEATVEKLKAS
ncbi:MAG TPA: histidine kinase, partial [Dehalococcoidia bacterium]|nr:histidine kinase [Dehalococcoidia bacterium]